MNMINFLGMLFFSYTWPGKITAPPYLKLHKYFFKRISRNLFKPGRNKAIRLLNREMDIFLLIFCFYQNDFLKIADAL